MELTNDILVALKIVETDILREFVGVCNKLNLRYYLLGGTLLGAVRHQGFIPWDDDIDVGMPREDYEKFISLGQAYLPNNYFIQTFMTDPGYPANFAKIRNNNTTFVETSLGGCDINHGVYIDIFPLDYYPEERAFAYEVEKLLLTLRISTVFAKTKMKMKTRIVRLISCVLYPSHKKALIRRETMFKTVPKSGLIANNCGAWGKKEIVPADWYGEGVPVMFEGMQLMAPVEYDKWLTQVYGDYMQLPPVEKRVGHHFVDVIDLSKPYTEYMRKK